MVDSMDTTNPAKKNDSARKIPLTEAKKAAASLAESFADDVIARYYLQLSDSIRPLNASQAKLNLRVYECLTTAHCYKGLVIVAGPSYEAVGLWLPPGSAWNWRTYWRSGMWSLWLRLGLEGRKRLFGSWDMFEEGMKSVMGSRSSITWVLTDLGTLESSRRQGYAKRVTEYGLALADAQSQPAYVECCDYNVSFYEKFGFRKRGTLLLDRAQDPIILHTMVREPEDLHLRQKIQRLELV
ncbi:hypothetical protein BJ878DRAFT_545993 [Calycina marina]|uniref:N-acetyltransferase domain-containing protein n=1 Tax=Calycina marina TaxID=1763456 RepID=A0A9P7YVZ4_9HELO|nr:hypothetical protein BJ878DRAFT_545993 [Calycina marina]